MNEIKTALVLGVGNTRLADKGSVFTSSTACRSVFSRKDVAFVDGGTLSFSLAGLLAEHARLIGNVPAT